MKRSFLTICSIILAGTLLTACGGEPVVGGNTATPAPSVIPTVSTPTSSPTESQEPAGILSSFATTDLEGNEVTQDIFADYDVTMVNIWATFCSPCLGEMPALGELNAEYADKGFQIVGLVSDTLNQDGTISDSQVVTAKDAVAATDADYVHLLPSEDLFGLLSQVSAVPTTLFVDKDGAQVGSAVTRAYSKEEWVAIIDDILAEVQG